MAEVSDILLKVSVIVVNYNTRAMTLECLHVLHHNLTGIPAEVFVVDNASTDESAGAIRNAFPGVRLIENAENRGFGAANNQAIRIARGDYILLLNSDAFPKPHAIEQLASYLDGHPDVAIVGPRLLNRDGSLQKSCYRFPSAFRAACDYLLLTAAFPNNPIVGDYRGWAHDHERDVEFVIGACMLVRKSAIDAVGLFDEDFFFYGEEADWCRRFRVAGWKVRFIPGPDVSHLNGASGAAQSSRVFDEFRRAQERFVRKHHGVLGLAVMRIVVVIGALMRIAVFSATALFSRAGRERRLDTVRKWGRILVWTLGRRGPGLARPRPNAATGPSVAAVAVGSGN